MTRRKYGNRRVKRFGLWFDSKREADRYTMLLGMVKDGRITDLQRQVPIHLDGRDGPILTPTGRKMRYVADFTYTDVATGLTVIEDAKGFPTPDYKIKRAIVQAMGLEIVEV